MLGPAHPLRGGIAAFNERLAQELISSGHEVQMESFSLQYPSILFPGKTQNTSDPAPSNLSIDASINSINPFNWIQLGRRLRKMKPDLVLTSFWMPFMGPALGTIQRMIRKNKHTKIIGLVHNIIPHEKRIGDRLLSNYFTKYTDEFVVMSKSVAEDIRSFSSTKPVKYLSHPIYDNYGEMASRSESLAFLNLKNDYRYLLFFGLIRDYKGLDLLIDAMAIDEVQGLKTKVIVAGEFYGGKEKYEDQIAKLGLQDRFIIYPDYIPNDDVRYFFGASDVLIQPYKTATQSGISQLAYHFELPMIVTNVGGLPEIIQNGKSGMISEVDPQALAQCIAQYFQNQNVETFKEGLRQAKKDFSWDIFVNKLLTFGH
jgi:glycosyltransferase involved in cell wall biosynthesis